MSTSLLSSKAFKKLLAGEFPLPTASSCGWFFEQDAEQKAEFRALVRSFCALGATAFSLLAEAVEHQGITRKKLSKTVEDVESLGFIIITEGDKFLEMSYRLRPSLLGEDVLFAVDDMLDTLEPSRLAAQTNSTAPLSP